MLYRCALLGPLLAACHGTPVGDTGDTSNPTGSDTDGTETDTQTTTGCTVQFTGSMGANGITDDLVEADGQDGHGNGANATWAASTFTLTVEEADPQRTVLVTGNGGSSRPGTGTSWDIVQVQTAASQMAVTYDEKPQNSSHVMEWWGKGGTVDIVEATSQGVEVAIHGTTMTPSAHGKTNEAEGTFNLVMDCKFSHVSGF